MMDHDQVCVRPDDVLLSSSNKVAQSSTLEMSDAAWSEDQRFISYASSPESMASYNDDNAFSPVEPESRKLLDTIKLHVSPYQDQLGPHASFPIQLSPLQEHLVSTYLTGTSTATHEGSSEMRPYPAATILSIAIRVPALFHIILATAAQDRLDNDQSQTLRQQRELECMVMAHKGEAMQLVQGVVQQGDQSEELIVSIMGFGMLERCCRDDSIASLHFAASRQLLKSIGGPLCIQNVLLSRSIAYFECGYGSSTESFVWDRSDFGTLHMDLNKFFTNLWTFQAPPPSKYHTSRRSSTASLNSQSPYEQNSSAGLQFDAALFECLSRRPKDANNLTVDDRRDMVFQLTCLLTLSALMIDYWSDPHGFYSYVNSTHNLVAASQTPDQPINNIMWLLQINDHSEIHSKRVWSVAGWTWVLRHVNYSVQNMVKGWLIAILTRRPVSRALKLDPFAFSYAT